ncbi:MAG: hypothetical protein U0871_15185 [Gemmataceae bacterium]
MPLSEQTYTEYENYKAGTASPETAERIGAILKDPDSDLSRWFGERQDALKARKRRHHRTTE